MTPPKFMVVLDPDKIGKYDAFPYDEPGPVPPFIRPPQNDQPKDGGVAKETVVPAGKPDPETKPS